MVELVGEDESEGGWACGSLGNRFHSAQERVE